MSWKRTKPGWPRASEGALPDAGQLRAFGQEPIPVASGPVVKLGQVALGGCRGWLHQAAGGTGVLMVGAIGFEGLGTYRAWRDLGARLARAGMPTLRLTLPGTGDAPEPDGLPDLVPRWLDAIDAASDWMRHALGLDEVVPCGLHCGALLVAHAAARAGGVGRLALLAPPISGRQFLRAQQMRARMAGFPTKPEPEPIETPALHLHRAAAHDIRSLSLLKIGTAPARRMLLLEPSGASAAGVMTKALTAQDAELKVGTFEGYNALMNDAHTSKRPDAAWQHVVDWLGEDAPGPCKPVRPSRLTPSPPKEELHGAGWIERSIRIPTTQSVSLAGVHSGPADGVPGGLAVVVLNVGANSNAGYGRGGTQLARRLAVRGVWSLRFDFAGIGESDGEEDVDVARLYDPARVAETRAVLDWLCSMGHQRFVLVGVCAGAFQAMQAGLSDQRVEGLVLANQLFYGNWHGGGLGGWQRRRQAHASRTLRQADNSATPATAGRQEPATPPSRQLLQIGLQAALRLEGLLVKAGLLAGLGTPRRRFRALAAQNVRTQVLVSKDDDALAVLETHFGPGAQGLGGIERVKLLVKSDLDHSLGTATGQHALLEAVEHLLCTLRYKPGADTARGLAP
jgi:hypothetical protein